MLTIDHQGQIDIFEGWGEFSVRMLKISRNSVRILFNLKWLKRITHHEIPNKLYRYVMEKDKDNHRENRLGPRGLVHEAWSMRLGPWGLVHRAWSMRLGP